MAERSKLLEQLESELDGSKVFATFYIASPEKSRNPLTMLGIPDEVVSNHASMALEAIEEMASEDSDIGEAWDGFLTRVAAFSKVHEVFDARLLESSGDLLFLEQDYFYFESRMLLAELVLAGLNSLYSASEALSRLVLEFSLLQCYYRTVCERAGDYSPLRQYFDTGKQPSWGTVLKKALPQDSFCAPIRSRAREALSGLSRSASHPYHPGLSSARHRRATLGPSLSGLLFWIGLDALLATVLWVYYANFPMLFHPVDVLRKFGFGGPVGLLVDESCGEAVRRSLSSDDYASFREYSLSHESTAYLLEWVESLPDLTDEQIEETWDVDEDGEFPGLETGYALRMAKMGSIRTAMAAAMTQPDPLPQDVPDISLTSLDDWKRLDRTRREKGRG